MKNFKMNRLALAIMAIITLSLQSCLKDECDAVQTYIQHDPVYMTLEEIRSEPIVSYDEPVEDPGKIFYFNELIILNDVRKGFHIIDNSNPSTPTNISFVAVPGNVDIAVKQGVLYADNFLDLLAFDISNPASPVLTHREEDVFSSLSFNEDLGHLLYYEKTEKTVDITCTDSGWGDPWFFANDAILVDVNTQGVPAGESVQPDLGVAGSMSRFSLYNNFLYTIDNSNIDVFDISSLSNPAWQSEFSVSWGIETLYGLRDLLFIGSETGMFIYSLSNPASPEYLSDYGHWQACDPVFVSGDFAFVTLRDGTFCQGFSNQLDVLDVSDVLNPILLHTYPMDNPHGLSIKDDKLYLCEGEHGLKVFDVSDIDEIDNNQIETIEGVHTFDVIAVPNKDVIIVTGSDGLYQYDNSDPSNLLELSKI